MVSVGGMVSVGRAVSGGHGDLQGAGAPRTASDNGRSVNAPFILPTLDLLWYPTIGRARIRAFRDTPWGQLFEHY